MQKKVYLHTLLFILLSIPSFSQEFKDFPVVDYSNPQKYEIAELTISGIQFLDTLVIKSMSGLAIGQIITIPGEDFSKIIQKFWEQGFFSDIKITLIYLEKNKVRINIYLLERARIASVKIEVVSKTESKHLTEKLNLKIGSQITQNLLNNSTNTIKKHYIDKGFYNLNVEIIQKTDEVSPNKIHLTFKIEKNDKVKINDVIFRGNKVFESKRLRRTLKKTHRRDWNFFKSSRLVESDYKEDKENLIKFYNEKGFRDFKILKDSIEILNKKRLNLYIDVFEGHKYYFGNIVWIGNTLYTTEILNQVLKINKGDVFDQTILDKRLQIDQDAVSSLYLDNGYLFFSLSAVETAVHNDTIDFEMRMYEGKQATINNIIIKGNTKTNEHVVRRELKTLPGELFSKADIVRTVRELATLGHFEPEKIEPNPIPNTTEGNVDLEYKLVERANDQLELSGGYGANMFIGTVGVRFSNFSYRNVFTPSAWRPIPSGDGESLSIRAQTNGKYYTSYNGSFIEPWFGGKKPNSLSVSLFYSKMSQGTRTILSVDTNYMLIRGGSIGLGRRLRWPDDFFTLYNEVAFQNYDLNNYKNFFSFTNGSCNNLNVTTTITRNSIDQPIYPRRGSKISLTVSLTPPYSMFNRGVDYSTLALANRYHWVEYNKWTFKSEYYTKLAGNLVLATKAQFGILGMYNSRVGPSPFESYDVGGDGWTGFNLYGRELIGLRGYANGSLTPLVAVNGNVMKNVTDKTSQTVAPTKSGNIYDKFTFEFRYPITLKEQATVYAITFLEGGNCWYGINDFDPLSLKRSAGFGIRAFLPMFGMLGIDWGYGFDNLPVNPGQNHSQFAFYMGQQL